MTKTLEKEQVEEIATLIHSLSASLWKGVSNLEMNFYGKELTISIKHFTLDVSSFDNVFEFGFYNAVLKPVCDASKWISKFVDEDKIFDSISLKNIVSSWNKDLKTLNQKFSKNEFLEDHMDIILNCYNDNCLIKSNKFDNQQFTQDVMKVYQDWIDNKNKQKKPIKYRGVEFTKEELETLLKQEYTN
jgi:hypothetical protein